MKYLLSTGETTYKFDEYILDLFKMYTQVYPGDIPGALDYGFSFLLTDVVKEDLEKEVRKRIFSLIDSIKGRFSSSNLTIELVNVDVIDETQARVVINVNNHGDSEVTINLT